MAKVCVCIYIYAFHPANLLKHNTHNTHTHTHTQLFGVKGLNGPIL
jgi:replication initiation and membrane attachment protein DnaB